VTGTTRFAWDLKDESDRNVSNGTYYIRVETGSGRTTIRKVLVLK